MFAKDGHKTPSSSTGSTILMGNPALSGKFLKGYHSSSRGALIIARMEIYDFAVDTARMREIRDTARVACNCSLILR